MRLRGQTAIITGATSGMGKAIAERFAKEGASAILSGRDTQRGKDFELYLVKKGSGTTNISIPFLYYTNFIWFVLMYCDMYSSISV